MTRPGTRMLAFGAAVALSSLGAAGLVRAGRGGPQATSSAGPVVVELFTSEGCSSCPPADRVLSGLVAAGAVGQVPVVALSEHVDYWDRQGWKDPFSSSLFTERQDSYARALNSQLYTPQMVIDGRFQMIGSDRSLAQGAIARAGQEGKARVAAEVTRNAGAVTVRATVDPGDLGQLPDADLYVAVTESGLASDVTAGENRGRRLEHAAVTRLLEKAGHVKAGRKPARVSETFTLDPAWAVDRTRIVLFVQARSGRAIVGAWVGPVPAGDGPVTGSR
jgi:hypothetical protein